MTRFALSLVLFLSTVGVSRLDAQEAADLFALPFERHELDSGLEVVFLPDATRDEVAVELWTHAQC